MLEEIINEFGLPESPKHHVISQTLVKRWMESQDIEILGAVSSYLLKKEYTERIEPQLTFEDIHPFIMAYYERCLLENPDGDWADSSYEAAWDLANWFNYLWSEKERRIKEIEEFKQWVGNLYKTGDRRLQNCIINGVVEHLFEDKKIRTYFNDWKKDPLLKEAYTQGVEWSG